MRQEQKQPPRSCQKDARSNDIQALTSGKHHELQHNQTEKKSVVGGARREKKAHKKATGKKGGQIAPATQEGEPELPRTENPRPRIKNPGEKNTVKNLRNWEGGNSS